MSKLRTVMFIDGRNFKYNLRSFGFKSTLGDRKEARDYLLDEKHFRWREFFLGIINKFNIATECEHRLIRTYWYNAGRIRPFSVNEDAIENIIKKYRPEYPEIDRNKIIALAKAWWDKESENFATTKNEIYEGIQRRTDFLEFKYVGEYVVRPFEVHRFEKREDESFIYQGVQKGEKGVDVGIAVDMVVKMPEYDVAILVSGDADFMPAVCEIKDNLKNVYQFSIGQGIPPNIKHLSPWLKGIVDVFQYYDELELLSSYFNPKSVPPGIRDAVEKRITELEKIRSGST